MRPVIINPKSKTQLNVVTYMLKQLGIVSHVLSDEEVEDLGLSILMREADRSKKASKHSIMRKLRT